MIKKIRFYKNLLVEILETLCSICLYLDNESRRGHNHYGLYMYGHFKNLKYFSEKLRKGLDNDTSTEKS